MSDWRHLTRRERIDAWVELFARKMRKQWERRWRKRFDDHKGNAQQRGIPFRFTFDQWLDIWTRSGHLHERGTRRGQYVMARHGDRGGYEVGNVSIVTVEQNSSERATGAGANLVTFRLSDKLWSEADAWAKAHDMTRSEAIRTFCEAELKGRGRGR